MKKSDHMHGREGGRQILQELAHFSNELEASNFYESDFFVLTSGFKIIRGLENLPIIIEFVSIERVDFWGEA